MSVLRGAGNNAIASVIMRLSCPNCQTEYDVPDAALTGRARTLRCAKCMTKFQAPALEAAPPEPETEPADTPENDGEAVMIDQPESVAGGDPELAEAQKHEWVSMLQTSRELPATKEAEPFPKRGLAISALVVLLLILAALVEHRSISNFWPPSLRLFHALGLR